MNRELNASSLTPIYPLISNSLSSEANDNISAAGLSPIRCGFADNNVAEYLWSTKGSQLDIVSVGVGLKVSNQRLLGSIDFSQVFKDKTVILNVLQLSDITSINTKYTYTLLVALRRSSGACLLCLIDVRLSHVLKTIEIPFRITSLELISTEKPQITNWPLIDELLQMNGIVAIGTEGGLVFILDLFLDIETPLHEALIPKKLSFIPHNSMHMNLKTKRKTASLHDQLLCLPLNSDSHHKNRFVYKADDGTVLSAFPKAQVLVSALQFIPQTSMLCIGFSFGGFQFYNLKTFRLECSCGLEYGLPPVVRFVFQDPENDPKNYSYIWVIRGQEIEDNSNSESSQQSFNSISTAIMYSISFETKEWISEYGILYSGFQGCSCRYEYILGTSPHQSDHTISCSSRLIDCYSIPLGNYSALKTSDDESLNLDLSLLFIAWEALPDTNEGSSSTYFAIFDLNQWYRSQMPTDLKTGNDKAFCPYLGVFSLIDIANSLSPDAILSVKINRDSIKKFRSQAFQDDIHYFPSSLSFNVKILTESQICSASYLGLPRRCLSQMNVKGPDILIDPKDYINNCVISGLLPYDILQSNLSTQLLREIVLTVALENDCLPFLIQVIKDWSSGYLTQCGCDSKFLLEWVWKRVSSIKSEIDTITYPLFNFSGQSLDNFNLSQLYAYESDLKSLTVLLKELQRSGAPTTVQGMQELALRLDVTRKISEYLRIVLWLYFCNLLPEYSEEDVYGEQEVAYPYSQFKDYYTKRRAELHRINPSVIQPTDLLLIDGMIESMNPSLSALWIKGGGDGLYPPPNLHSLIGIFLMDSVSTVQKQALMLYSLLDLSEFLSDRQSDIVEKFRNFPSVFGLKPGLTKMIQGFWGLDHKLFDFAVRYLLDPMIKPLLLGTKDNEMFVFNDLQQRIVTSLLYQEEVRSALIYSKSCGQFSLDTPLREKLHLNMLLLNQQISEAFHFQRRCRNESNAVDLLNHLFLCCEKMGAFEKIFDMSLDEFEEEILKNYLLTSSAPNSKQMLVLYLIVNDKIIDASNALKEFREEFNNITDKKLAEKTNQLIILVDAYMKALPPSLTRLATEIAIIEEKKLKEKPKITISDAVTIRVKPTPIAFDCVGTSKAIETIMEQIADMWTKEGVQSPDELTPPLETKKSSSKMFSFQNSPFLRTPTAGPRSAKKTFSSKTVYPLLKLTDFEEESVVTNKSRPTDESSLRTKSNIKGSEQLNRGSDSSRNQLLSILDTPSIKRKFSVTKTKANYNTNSSQNCFTPTSILKVKQLMIKSTSPSSLMLSPVSSKTSNKPLESTPIQHRLRFSVPTGDNSYNTIPEEDSVENARLASTKDTLMLKTLRTGTVIEEVVPTEENTTNLIELNSTVIEEESHKILSEEITKTPDKYSSEVSFKPNYVFSPPQTRSSAKKTQKKVVIKTEDKPIYQFSQLEEQKTPQKQKNTKQKQKKEKKPQKSVETTEKLIPSEEPQTSEIPPAVQPPVQQTSETVEPVVKEYPSRASTPASNVDDSDNKSDISHVSSSKVSASSRSSRSKTPTKKASKKVTETPLTPTHTMKLRTSTTKPKKEK